MSKEIFNTQGFFGMTNHTDEEGNSLGFSMPGLFKGETDHFGPNGEYLGTSYEGFFGMTDHVDAGGNYLGASMQGVLDGSRDHFNASGEYVGTTYESFIGTAYEGSDPELGLFGSAGHED